MACHNYNGDGRWSVEEVLRRYEIYSRRLRSDQFTDLTPTIHEEHGNCWIYPIMTQVIKGIEHGDPACVEIGIEFIEESASFHFGMILKSKTARVLRNVVLTGEQKDRIRRRVVAVLRDGYAPRETRDYVRLVRRIGLGDWRPELERVDPHKPWVRPYYEYLMKWVRNGDAARSRDSDGEPG